MIERNKKIWFSIFLGMVMISIGIFMLKIRPIQNKASILYAEYRAKLDQKKRLISRHEGKPTDALKRAVYAETQLLKTTCMAGIEKLGLRKQAHLPDNIGRPSIYWLDVLRKTRAELLDNAKASGVEIPRNLSFSDAIPAANDIPALLTQLRIVEDIVSLAIRSGVESVSGLTLGAEEIIRSGDGPFLAKLTVSFSLTGNLQSLINFIYSLEKINSFYAIKDISVESKEGTLKTALTVSSLYHLTEKEVLLRARKHAEEEAGQPSRGLTLPERRGRRR